ncbi:MAG: T9SS type A sorting domain-containing protein [Brumimicrobium sp.]
MKKHLLVVASVFFGFTSYSQFTYSNSPAIGESIILHEIDSLSPNYEDITGNGAYWDYHTFGSRAVTRSVSVVDADLVDLNGRFTGSEKAIVIENLLKTYITDNTAQKIGQGFSFIDPTVGETDAVFDLPGETLYEYPFDFGDLETGNVSGTAYVNFAGTPMELPFSGTYTSEVDGQGTLSLALNEYQNVTRYKISENIEITSPLGQINLVRKQFEYYDHNISNLPIFLHVSVSLGGFGDQFLVLSLEDPGSLVSVPTNVLEQINIYPNPAQNIVNVKLPAEIDEATLIIFDVLGNEIKNISANQTITSINVEDLNRGTYFVKIATRNNSIIKNVVIK